MSQLGRKRTQENKRPHQATPEAPARLAIDHVGPEINGGRFPTGNDFETEYFGGPGARVCSPALAAAIYLSAIPQGESLG